MSLINRINNKYNLALEKLEYGINYLKRFGYILDGDITLDDAAKAIAKFQTNFGITIDGELGPECLRAMSYFRCGCADNITEDATNPNKWGLKELTYYVDSYVKGLSKEEQLAIYKAGADYSSTVCGIKFRKVDKSSDANIVILTSSSVRDGLGSAGEVLAFAYLPPKPNYTGQLTVTLDLAETWINNPRARGILLLNVINHECFMGHSMGLSHTSVPNQLMNPYYNVNVEVAQPQDDIPKLQTLYGKPTVTPTPPPTPVPSPTPTPAPTDELIIKVKGKIDSVDVPGYRVTKI